MDLIVLLCKTFALGVTIPIIIMGCKSKEMPLELTSFCPLTGVENVTCTAAPSATPAFSICRHESRYLQHFSGSRATMATPQMRVDANISTFQ